MKILQLGKFYPVLGGVEKVMFDLTVGLSETGLSKVGLSKESEFFTFLYPKVANI